MGYLYVGCMALVLFVISLRLGKKKKSTSDYIFIVWLLVFILNLSSLFIVDREGYPSRLFLRILVEVSEAFVFLHGPLLWYYTRSLTEVNFRVKKRDLLQLIPFLIYLSVAAVAFIGNTGISGSVRNSFLFLKFILMGIYLVIVILRLRIHKTNVDMIFSNSEHKYLKWLTLLSWGMLVVFLVFCINMLIGRFISPSGIYQYNNIYGNAALCLFIYVMGYFGVQQESIFVINTRPTAQLAPETRTDPVLEVEQAIFQKEEKYRKSGLGEARAIKIHADLKQLMLSGKPYLNPDLTLFTLAEQLDIPANYLSQVINTKEEVSFADLINAYRVNAVIDQIKSGKLGEHTLLGIAFDSGFNSKASFNRAFRKHTGFTPTDFKNQPK